MTTGFETTTRETTQTITPDRDGETISATQVETRRGLQVVNQSREYRTYGQDVYGGSRSYGIQLRLYPLNPWVKHAEKKGALRVRECAIRMLDAALQRAALSAQREYYEILFMRHKREIMQRHEALLRLTLQQLLEMKKAQVITAADYHKRYAETLVFLSRLPEIEQQINSAEVQLKARAGLSGQIQISYDHPLITPCVEFNDLAQFRLFEMAQSHHPELTMLQSEIADIESQISSDRASAIPWVSVVSFDYGYDENANDQTRDEWGVFAGVGVPVERWVNRKPQQALRAKEESARQQILLIQQELELRIADLCQSFALAQSNGMTFEASVLSARQSIEAQMIELGDDDITSRQTTIALSESLLQMELRELELAHRTSSLLFDLCETVGYNLDTVVSQSSAVN